MGKVLLIVGPTAIGKTDFGIECAKHFNGEIISGDSMQVYKGLDIGTAKPSAKDQVLIKHHLIDIKNPNENYNVKDFQELARKKINELFNNEKLPIIVGGTGLYIKALIYDYVFYEENARDNPYNDLNNKQIYEILLKKDPEALKTIDINNRKRLVRALNIYEKHNVGISEIKNKQAHKLIYDCLIIGLSTKRESLYERIEKRVDSMINNGLIEEINNLINNGVSFDNQCMQAIGYKEFRDYFEKNKNIEECIKQVKRNSRHFAKRQYTFFNNQMDVEWYENKDEAMKRIEKWLI